MRNSWIKVDATAHRLQATGELVVEETCFKINVAKISSLCRRGMATPEGVGYHIVMDNNDVIICSEAQGERVSQAIDAAMSPSII